MLWVVSGADRQQTDSGTVADPSSFGLEQSSLADSSWGNLGKCEMMTTMMDMVL